MSGLQWFYGTFGENHLDGTGQDKYALIRAASRAEAHEVMWAHFGPRFCTIYESAQGAGVDRYGLKMVNPHGEAYTMENAPEGGTT